MSEVILSESLKRMLSSKKVPHALILQSTPENKAKKQAQALAMALLCTGETDNKPCNTCKSCVKALALSNPDIQIFTGKTEKTFGIDVVRLIRKLSYIRPNESYGKVFILKGSGTMTVQAQNALLKILEEPPSNVTFILCAKKDDVFLSTILSRATSVLLDNSQIIFEVSDEVIELTNQLSRAIVFENEYKLISITSAFERKRPLFIDCVNNLVLLFRDVLLVRSGSSVKSFTENAPLIRELATGLTTKQSMAIISALEEIIQAIERNANTQLMITYFSSEMSRAVGR